LFTLSKWQHFVWSRLGHFQCRYDPFLGFGLGPGQGNANAIVDEAGTPNPLGSSRKIKWHANWHGERAKG